MGARPKKGWGTPIVRKPRNSSCGFTLTQNGETNAEDQQSGHSSIPIRERYLLLLIVVHYQNMGARPKNT